MNFASRPESCGARCVLGALAGMLILCGAGASAQTASSQDETTLVATATQALPDTPQPAAAQNSGAAQQQPASAEGSDFTQYFLATSNSRYSTVLKPGEQRAPFTVREKFIYSIRESVSPEEIFIFTLGAGYNQFINGNPHYGTDGNGFGERVGTSALRETSIHFLGDGVFASALHQDPRYFAMGRGQPLKRRVMHVVASAVTSHSDRDGHVQPDYSGITGRAATAAMTLTYYPHISATNTIAAETFGYSLLGDMAGNALLEFLPDFLHKRRQPH